MTMASKVPAGRLQHEIRQSRPFASLAQEASLALLRTADEVRRQLARVVECHGLTLQQYNVLRILRGASGEPLPTLEIGERMIERTPGITRLLDRLERRGWVRRERSSTDRRQVLCTITDAGLELLGELDEPVDAADAELLDSLPEPQLRRLIELLDRVRAEIVP